jgi:transposase-like protein
MATSPGAGRLFPKNDAHFRAWFATDADCLDYIAWLRWPTGFSCELCGSGGWQLSDGRYECAKCHKRTSVTAGTIFDRTRTPLSVWVTACWYFATDKDGVSALSLQRRLGIVSYQTAWAMLARLRAVMDDREKELLAGEVEADETFLGGHTKGQRGGREHGAKVLVGIAVERATDRNGFGRARLCVLEDASARSLRGFLRERVAEGSRVVTDGWGPYKSATEGHYEHVAHTAPGETAAVYLPAAHRVASLLKRWLLSTHQGSFGWDHVPLYLAEFEFRFNRRRSASRGLVFYRLMKMIVAHSPVRYRDLVMPLSDDEWEDRSMPTPPAHPAPRTPSVELPSPGRPWRAP